MQIFIRGGAAGKLFMTKCRSCRETFNWNKLVVIKYDWGEEWNHCVPCHEEIHGKLDPKGFIVK